MPYVPLTWTANLFCHVTSTSILKRDVTGLLDSTGYGEQFSWHSLTCRGDHTTHHASPPQAPSSVCATLSGLSQTRDLSFLAGPRGGGPSREVCGLAGPQTGALRPPPEPAATAPSLTPSCPRPAAGTRPPPRLSSRTLCTVWPRPAPPGRAPPTRPRPTRPRPTHPATPCRARPSVSITFWTDHQVAAKAPRCGVPAPTPRRQPRGPAPAARAQHRLPRACTLSPLRLPQPTRGCLSREHRGAALRLTLPSGPPARYQLRVPATCL